MGTWERIPVTQNLKLLAFLIYCTKATVSLAQWSTRIVLVPSAAQTQPRAKVSRPIPFKSIYLAVINNTSIWLQPQFDEIEMLDPFTVCAFSEARYLRYCPNLSRLFRTSPNQSPLWSWGWNLHRLIHRRSYWGWRKNQNRWFQRMSRHSHHQSCCHSWGSLVWNQILIIIILINLYRAAFIQNMFSCAG